MPGWPRWARPQPVIEVSYWPGGYAVQAHGILQRLSDDVDLFTDQGGPIAFDTAVNAVREAYEEDGLIVEVVRLGGTFARLLVTDDNSRQTKVEMGYDWRAEPPVVTDVGPVLHPDDAVANKVTALQLPRGGTRLR